MKLFALFVIVALAASFAQDQTQEPTYEQTQKWIVSKLSEGGYTHNYNDSATTGSYEKISMDDCKLFYTNVEFLPGGGYIPDKTIKYETVVPLDKVSDIFAKHIVDPRSIDEWDVLFKAPITGRMVTTKRGVVGEEMKNFTEGAARLIFGRSPATDEDTATRMNKAFTHAVVLCKKMKEKEPF
jgi:hypothetical protein